MEKNVREGDITAATSHSQEEEVAMQANAIDENLDNNMEELNAPMKIIHESIKIIPLGHAYGL